MMLTHALAAITLSTLGQIVPIPPSSVSAPEPARLAEVPRGHSMLAQAQIILPTWDCQGVIDGFLKLWIQPLELSETFLDRTGFCMHTDQGALFAYQIRVEPLTVGAIPVLESAMAQVGQAALLGATPRFQKIRSLVGAGKVELHDSVASVKPVASFSYQESFQRFVDYQTMIEQENGVLRSSSMAPVADYLQRQLGTQTSAQALRLLKDHPVLVIWHLSEFVLDDGSSMESDVAYGNFRDCKDPLTPCI